ncbi:D-arabinono-1,4-lactone oxidase KNAG_0J00130 [Huiozyma naganishii CBS 8797]|uniref:D-arabinono-1,4-lactone oxidase n=1 Tax=Huiozyma naganishii (strain ATCC MYA-139 / BCRC 22969 / CBS 8797 / KCTC 17520 / NBRC 10181 / NCYC 3082 / Yp74L-3) TaxID=1071383 RepID=J7SAE6_HUIN7|nr:hypothetical protein KNAG_0J00130 [Kazachstania naganishii CBS 8797]CCK72096.1 hypothetical protein KNAG_0J00130 [Kazachstania naganishii CBS 8797]
MSTVTVANMGQKNYVFKNWAGVYSTKPQLYFQPATRNEVKHVVNQARKQGKHLITVGSGHTPNTLCMYSEWMLNLDKLNDITAFDESPDKNYADVTVGAGIRIFELNEYLDPLGYTIQNLPSILIPSLGGVISTGTHGSSAYHGLLSSQIVNLTMINGSSEVLFLDSEHHPDIFKAALLSLGKIGIIVEVTIRVVPKFNLKCKQEMISFDQMLEMWDYVWTSSEFIRLWWYPYNDKCILWRAEKTEQAPTKGKKGWLTNRFNRILYEALLWVCVKLYGPLTPYVERFVFNRQFRNVGGLGHGSVEVTGSMDGLSLDCLYSQFVDEWAIPMDNGPEVLRSLQHSVSSATESAEFYVHSPVEIRCSNTTVPDELTIEKTRSATSVGPVYGNIVRPYLDISSRDPRHAAPDNITNSQLTLFINATVYRPFGFNSPVHKWFSLFEDTLTVAGGRPHWAKNFLGSPKLALGDAPKPNYLDYECRGLGKKIREWYGTDLQKFLEIRNQQDPSRVFTPETDWTVTNGFS